MRWPANYEPGGNDWRLWFAWRPVRVGAVKVWLEWVEWRYRPSALRMALCNPRLEYRLP
jgi:hypothetical protein